MTTWTEEKNQRRCDLIDLGIAGVMNANERLELASLQTQMLIHRRQIAPLPIEEARATLDSMKQTER